MKSIKKTLVFVVCFAMLLGLAACAQTAAPTATTAPATSAPATVAPATSAPAAAPVEITYAQWGTADETVAAQKVADTFNSQQSKIHVTVMQIDHDSYITKLNTMATAGTLPDCAIMSEAAVIQWAQQGMLADVSSMYAGGPAPLPSLAFKYQGKTVAYSAANEILTMYYNKDMFDKAGVSYPPTSEANAWTWDQFVATAKKLTLDKNGKHPDDPGFDAQNIVQYGACIENLTWQLEEWCLSNGGGFYSADGSKVTITDPASIEAIQKIADLYLKDHVAPLSTGLTDDGVQRALISGTCAMTTNGTWNVGTCLGDAKKKGLNYGVAVLPYMQKKVDINTAGPNVVFNQSKHQAEAMEWLKWYDDAKNNWSLISSGIWMPLTSDYYTDETLTHKWVDNPNFPPYADYKSAVVDVAGSNIMQPASWFYVNNTNDFNTLLGSILGDVWTGKITAQAAITANADKLNAAFQGS